MTTSEDQTAGAEVADRP